MPISEAQYTPISVAASGNNTLVAAQGAGVKIRVVCLVLTVGAGVSVKFQSGAGGTDLTGPMALPINGLIVLKHSAVGWFETAANALLNLNLSGAVQTSGALIWQAVS